MLETTRLHETLSVGTSLIVSERSCDADAEARLSGIVDFVPEGDVAALEERISYWLSHEDERVKRVEQNNELFKKPREPDEVLFQPLPARKRPAEL